MDSKKSADKLRGTAEREDGPAKRTEKERQRADTEAAEVHGELTHPELSKGRPAAGDEATGERRPSNAGTDGP